MPRALDVRFRAGDRQRARRLENRAGVLEHVLDRRADRVGVDEDHLVDEPCAQAESLLADLLHRDAVGEQADLVELHAPARLERAVHRVGVGRLDADDADLGAQPLHVSGDAGNEPAAADRHENRMDRLRVLAQDLHADRALARDHVGIVVGMHEREFLAALERSGVLVGFVVGVAVQHDFRAARRAPRRP